VFGFSDVAIDKELGAGQGVAELTCDDPYAAGLNHNVGDDFTLPPDWAIEVTARTSQLLANSDFSLFGPETNFGLFAGTENERAFVAKLKAVALINVDPVDCPLEDKEGQPSNK
jgi:hypothetical protein